MMSKSALERYFSAHAKLREKEDGKKPRVRPFVTISREAGAGGHTLGKRLVEILNQEPRKAPWTLFDKEVVDVVIKQHNLPESAAEYLAESKMSTIHELFADLLGISPGSDTMIRKTKETLITLAQMGNCVLIGRGGSLATKALKSGFRVRLVASKERRLERIQENYTLSEREAEELMQKVDSDRRDYVRIAYGKDVSDPLNYDCVINTTGMSCDDTAWMIAAYLQRR
jgi:cytidylate kinase